MKMKKHYLIPLFFALCCMAISCNKEEIESKKATGTITFSYSSIINSAKKALGENLKDSSTASVVPAAIIVSITDATGNMVSNMEEIPLYNMSGNYISKPIALERGSYKLSDFLVVDKDGNVIYLTPKEGSSMAYLVSDPLPIEFSVSKDQVTKVNVEVLANEGQSPEEFGYTTFSFDVVKVFSFNVSVFTYNDTTQNFQLTNSEIEIYKDSSKIYANTLSAIENAIALREEAGSYTVVIKKDGYQAYSTSFTLSDLQEYTASNPLIVILSKAGFDLTSGLVAYYPFNGNANDESGNNHNGTVLGATPTTDRHDSINSAYEFDGIDDYINTFSTFDYEYRTVSFWACITDLTTFQVLMCQDSYLLSNGLFLASIKNGLFYLQGGGTYASAWYQSDKIATNKWYHFVMVRNGSTNQYYINGILVGNALSNTISSTVNPNINFVIGTGRALSEMFKGKIDDIAIYNRALTTDEINTMYSVK